MFYNKYVEYTTVAKGVSMKFRGYNQLLYSAKFRRHLQQLSIQWSCIENIGCGWMEDEVHLAQPNSICSLFTLIERLRENFN